MFVPLGLLIGFLSAIPLGPVNLFVVSQTLKRDFFHGLLGGLTTGLLDFLYCLVAIVGFFHIKVDLNPDVMSFMKVIAAAILVLFSFRLLRQSKTFSVDPGGPKLPPASAKPILGVALLYASNPTLYAFWFAVAGTMTGHNLIKASGWTAVLFALSCGLGSVVWYIILVRWVSRHQHRIKTTTVRKIFFFLGIALAGFAAFTLGTLVF